MPSYKTHPYFCRRCYKNGKNEGCWFRKEEVEDYDHRGRPRCPNCGNELRPQRRWRRNGKAPKRPYNIFIDEVEPLTLTVKEVGR